jgi:hypothetical protein
MSKLRNKKRLPKRVLALPDLEQSKAAVLNSLTSKSGQRTYACDHGLCRVVLLRAAPRTQPHGSSAIQNLSRAEAVRTNHNQPPTSCRPTVAFEAADSGLLSPELAAGIRRVKGVRRIGVRVGKLAHGRAGQATACRSGPGVAAGQEELRNARHAHRLWTPPGRSLVPPSRGDRIA